MLMSGMLARKFKFQPSEIGELDVEEFLDWVNEGKRQNEQDSAVMSGTT